MLEIRFESYSFTVSTVFPPTCHEVMGLDVMISVFWMLSFKPTFSLSSFTFIKRLFSSSLLSAIRVVSSALLFLKESESRSVVSNSSWPHGLQSPLNSPGRNTGVDSLSLLQGIFPTQGSNTGLPHCRRILYQLSHRGSPRTSNKQSENI